jgi:hypothetical protein
MSTSTDNSMIEEQGAGINDCAVNGRIWGVNGRGKWVGVRNFLLLQCFSEPSPTIKDEKLATE